MAETKTKQAIHNRVDDVFNRCRDENRAALVLYLTGGYPDLETTRRLLPVLAESGCDLIELGVPFSDPIADGPTIQRASTMALQAGATFPKVLDVLKEFRESYETPVVMFGALNPFLARGYEKSTQMMAEAGADGLLAADLPFDESEELRGYLDPLKLHLITLVAPSTPDKRLDTILPQSSGFVYCISMMGTTGRESGVEKTSRKYLERLRGKTKLPLALGFGISRPEHVRAAVDAGSDGVVVGSALIRSIDESGSGSGEMENRVSDFVRSLAAELKRG